MLSRISWSEFAVAALALVTGYYAVIGFLYRNEVKAFLQRKLSKNRQSGNLIAEDATEELEAVVNDLRYAVLERTGMHADKDELLQDLRNRLKDYESLHKPAFRYAINNYLIKHAKEINGAAFSVEELNEAWDTLLR